MKTPPNRPHANAPSTPPRGMWFEQRPNHPLPFRARWRLPGGKKGGQDFDSEKSRAAFAVEWVKKRKSFGVAAVHVGPRDAEALAEFRRITGGADLLTVAREWMQSRGALESGMNLSDALGKYRAILADRKLSPESVKQRDLHLSRLLAAYPSITLAKLDAAAINGWLRDLAPPRAGATVAAQTKRSHRGDVALFLEYAVGAGWLARSPMGAVPVPQREDKDVTILSVDQARALFDAARGTRCAGRLALEAFGGLRFSSAQRIVRTDLDEVSHGITFPGAKHKTGKRHYVEGFPPNLWGWVASAPASCWSLPPRLYALDKRAVFEAAGLKGEGKDPEQFRNSLRHSFATYHVALNRDAGDTARLLTHRNTSMLYQHYAGRATQAAAVEYFKITA